MEKKSEVVNQYTCIILLKLWKGKHAYKVWMPVGVIPITNNIIDGIKFISKLTKHAFGNAALPLGRGGFHPPTPLEIP